MSSSTASNMLLIWAIALAKFLLHVYFNNRYGYFRDEFDYIACANHLASGYVDQPPLIPFLTHASMAILGDSLRAIRFIPALASSLLVIQTALIAREFGGRRFALLLSAVTILIAPQYLSNGSLLTTNCIAYMRRLPFKLPVMEYAHERAALPQWYADQFGWNEIVEETAVAWNEIPPSERADCAIFAQDYGAAGAIGLLGRHYGLPPALSGHQTFFLWGPRGYSGDCLIVLDDRRVRLEQLFDSVRYVGESPDNPYALERRLPVWICRSAKFGTLAQIWPQLKKWR